MSWVFAEKHTVAAFVGTAWRALLSFLVAGALGTTIGAVIGSLGRHGKGFEAVIDFSRSIPAPALLPVFMTIFGLYTGPKIALACFACTLINVVYTTHGVTQEYRSLRVASLRVLSASGWFVFSRVVLPGAVESVVAGLRVTLSLALVLSVLAELVLMTGDGAGVLIRIAYEDRAYETMYALILLTGMVGFAFNRLFMRVQTGLLWKSEIGAAERGSRRIKPDTI